MRLIFMGTPDFAASALEALVKGGHTLLAAVSQPDKPVGRHAVLMPTAVRAKAEELGIPVLQPQKASDPEFLASIRQLQPEVIVVAAYGKILKQELLDIPVYGCINIHASLLPRWRGSAPIQWSIISGDEYTGVTTMKMNAGLDTGDILLQKKIRIAEDETGGSLFDRLAKLGGELILETLDRLKKHELTAFPQKDEDSTYAPMLSKDTGHMDFTDSAQQLSRLVRGLSPWPGTWTRVGGKKLSVLSVRPLTDSDPAVCGNECVNLQPGTFAVIGKRLLIRCGDGFLEILRLQPEGKKPMAADAFLLGNMQLLSGHPAAEPFHDKEL